MSEVTRTKNKIVVLCDCGATHTISMNPETEQLEINSTYKKQSDDNETKRIEKTEKKRDGISSLFDFE